MKNFICLVLLVLSVHGSAYALQDQPVQQAEAVQVVRLIQSLNSWDGTPLPAYPAGQPEVTILRITVPPGVRLPLHEHPVINAGVLLRGELTVVTEQGEALHLKAGEPIVEVVDKWHYGTNEGSEPAEIIVFYAGVQGESITVKQDMADGH